MQRLHGVRNVQLLLLFVAETCSLTIRDSLQIVPRVQNDSKCQQKVYWMCMLEWQITCSYLRGCEVQDDAASGIQCKDDGDHSGAAQPPRCRTPNVG